MPLDGDLGTHAGNTQTYGLRMTLHSTAVCDPGVIDLDRREDFCREVARTAGELARANFDTRDAGEFDMKGPQDFLTQADVAVEGFLRQRIAEAFPDDGFMGEETGGDVAAATWVVDPIDGTANFARGIPHFCTSIAFVLAGKVELGAIYNAGFDELYLARRGRGATRNGKSITVANTSSLDTASVELGWSNRRPNKAYMEVMAGILECGANVRRCSSGALGLAYVADGRSDAYAELHMHPWDCLAGLLLVREAGGVVNSYVNEGGLSGGGAVFAAAPGIADAVSTVTGIASAMTAASRNSGQRSC